MVDELLRSFVDFMDGLPSIPLMLAIALATAPLLALFHELGHAVVAVSRLPGRVHVTVGGEDSLISFELGRIAVSLHPLVLPWRFDGVCAYETESESRVDAIVIALAGPAASLAVGISGFALVGAVTMASWLEIFIAVASFNSVGMAIICLVPMTLTDTRGTTLRTDGANVLAALR